MLTFSIITINTTHYKVTKYKNHIMRNTYTFNTQIKF